MKRIGTIKYFILKNLFFALIVLIGLLSQASFAYATIGNVGAYPTNFDPGNPKTKSWFIYELKPGETKEDSITVVNNSDKEINVKVYPVDATTTTDGSFALLNQDQRQEGVGSWVTLEKELVTIGPRSEVQVPFTITVPKFTTVGDHAGGIIAQEVTSQSSQLQQGVGLNIVSRVGTRIYETVPGAQVVNLDAYNFQYTIAKDRLQFSFVMENKGNIILNPTGRIDIKDYSGKQIESIPLESLGSVFPGKPTTITAISKNSAPWFGKYTATLTIDYSPIKAVSRSITFFIYIKDWRVVLPVPVIILLIAIFFILRKLFFHAHRIKKLVEKQADLASQKAEEITETASKKVKETHAKIKETMEKLSTTVIPQPSLAPAYEPENIDQMFISHHIKLLVVLISISIIVLSSLFALILQQLVLSRVVASSQYQTKQEVATPTPLQPTPTLTPTPTNIPVNKADMKITVLNGTDKAGAAKTVAQQLTTAGFTVVKTGNADQNSSQTIIAYPIGKADGANQLQEALKPNYVNVTMQEASDSSEFIVTLGQ